MNPGNDTGSPHATHADSSDPSQSPPTNWREALMTLVSTRVALIQLESKDAVRAAGRKAIIGAAAAASLFFAWALLLVAGISLLASTTGWPWHAVALIAALAHLAAAAILVHALRKPVPPAFPHTRNEFQKDRQWIEKLQNPRKS